MGLLTEGLRRLLGSPPPPWLVPVLLSIALTFVSAWLTLKRKIRFEAWRSIYQEKRKEVREFLQAMDEFAAAIHYGWEIRKSEEDPPPAQITQLAFGARQLEREFGLEDDQILDELTDILPAPEDVEPPSTEAFQRLETVRQGLLNVVEERLQSLNVRIGQLRTTLVLNARDPSVLRDAHRTLVWAYEEVHQTDPFLRNFNLDAFVKEWRDRMKPVRLALRKDLNKSSRSLPAAVNFSWKFRFKRSWLGQKVWDEDEDWPGEDPSGEI